MTTECGGRLWINPYILWITPHSLENPAYCIGVRGSGTGWKALRRHPRAAEATLACRQRSAWGGASTYARGGTTAGVGVVDKFQPGGTLYQFVTSYIVTDHGASDTHRLYREVPSQRPLHHPLPSADPLGL